MESAALDIRTAVLRRLYQDWDLRRRGREFPARADFDPFDLKYILGDLSLIDVAYNPLRFRYRIYGSNLSERFGHELTGKNVDDIPRPEHARSARAHFEEILALRRPTAHYRSHQQIDRDAPHDCEVLALPLAADGKTIDMLMTAFAWDVSGLAVEDFRR